MGSLLYWLTPAKKISANVEDLLFFIKLSGYP